MDAIGWFIDMIIYMGMATALAGTALARLSEQDSPRGASPWRLRAPRLTLWACPLLFVAAVLLAVASAPASAALLIASLAAPIVAFAMVATEWLRRRAARRLARQFEATPDRANRAG